MARKFPTHSFVRTIGGVGEVTAYDAETQMYTVQLVNWTLSEGQAVQVHSHEHSLASIVGEVAETPYGVGTIVDLHDPENGIYKIELTSWTLSEGQKVYVFSTGYNFKVSPRALVETAEEQAPVEEGAPAPAAEAPVEEKTAVADAVPSVAVETVETVASTPAAAPATEEKKEEAPAAAPAAPAAPAAEEKQEEAPAVTPAETKTASPDVELKVGDKVKTPYGEGVVIEYRPEDQMYTVELTSWLLSGGSKVHVFTRNPFREESAVAPQQPSATCAPPGVVLPELPQNPIQGSTSSAADPKPVAPAAPEEKKEKKKGICCIA